MEKLLDAEKAIEIKISELRTLVPFYQNLMQTGMDYDKAMAHSSDISILEKELDIVLKAEKSVFQKGKDMAGESGVITKDQEGSILSELKKLDEKVLKIKGLAKVTVFPSQVTPSQIKVLKSVGLY